MVHLLYFDSWFLILLKSLKSKTKKQNKRRIWISFFFFFLSLLFFFWVFAQKDYVTDNFAHVTDPFEIWSFACPDLFTGSTLIA